MISKQQIRKTILEIAGDPSVGAIYTHSEKWADAIWKLYNPDLDPIAPEVEQVAEESITAKRETRITKPTEKR